MSKSLWFFSYVTTLLTLGGIPAAMLLHVLAYSLPGGGMTRPGRQRDPREWG